MNSIPSLFEISARSVWNHPSSYQKFKEMVSQNPEGHSRLNVKFYQNIIATPQHATISDFPEWTSMMSLINPHQNMNMKTEANNWIWTTLQLLHYIGVIPKTDVEHINQFLIQQPPTQDHHLLIGRNLCGATLELEWGIFWVYFRTKSPPLKIFAELRSDQKDKIRALFRDCFRPQKVITHKFSQDQMGADPYKLLSEDPIKDFSPLMEISESSWIRTQIDRICALFKAFIDRMTNCFS